MLVRDAPNSETSGRKRILLHLYRELSETGGARKRAEPRLRRHRTGRGLEGDDELLAITTSKSHIYEPARNILSTSEVSLVLPGRRKAFPITQPDRPGRGGKAGRGGCLSGITVVSRATIEEAIGKGVTIAKRSWDQSSWLFSTPNAPQPHLGRQQLPHPTAAEGGENSIRDAELRPKTPRKAMEFETL